MQSRSQAGGSKAALIAFRIVAGLGFVLFAVLTVLFAFPSYIDEAQKVHAFHNAATLASYAALSGVPMGLLAWRPRQVALLRLILATAIASVIGGLLSGVLFSYLLIGPLYAVVLLALSRERREVFRLGSPNVLLLSLAVVGAVPAVLEALRQADLQGGRTSGDEHLEMLHYAGVAVAYLTLILAGAWAAFPARAVRTARLLVGLGGAILAFGALAFPNAVSAIDQAWAIGLLVLSALYIVVSEVMGKKKAT